MKFVVIYLSVLVGCLGLFGFGTRKFTAKVCWCWPGDQHMVFRPRPQIEKNEYVSYGSYGSEVDWNNPERVLPLDYDQEQGKRIFYQHCVWCHADTTPAGPSNRSNVTPDPPLMNDGAVLNGESDQSLKRMIVLGGSAVGKSAMMPPYGLTLTNEEINDVITYIRVIAVPEYHKSLDKTNKTSRSKPS
jgi:mono/diheme cytochrome c family protein